MEPLAAFQVLTLTLAAAMAVEAFRSSETRWKLIFWLLFAILAAIGIASYRIADAWPAASALMVWVGSSPVALFFLFLTWVIFLQKPWRRWPKPVSANAGAPAADMIPALDDISRRLSSLEEGIESRIAAAPAPATMSSVERDRVSAALASVEDFLSSEYKSFADSIRPVHDFKKVMQSVGAKPIQNLVSQFAQHADRFTRIFESVMERYDTELSIADVSLYPLRDQTRELYGPAVEVARRLEKVPEDWQDPDLVAPIIEPLLHTVGLARSTASGVVRQIKEKRLEMAGKA